jgi:uncharacterized protein YajQ (UPF0234 family)
MFKFHEMTRSKLHDFSKQNKSEVQKEIKPFEVQVMESINDALKQVLHCIRGGVVSKDQSFQWQSFDEM